MARSEPPANFAEEVATRGATWIADWKAKTPRPSGRPPDYWSSVRDALWHGFGQRCGYHAMFTADPTVDHFRSWNEVKDTSPELAYDWSNYRCASALMNSIKQNAGGVLDPFEVEDDWFDVQLPSLQLMMSDRVPAALREAADLTLRRLHLVEDERVVRLRREWLRMYDAREISIEGLRRKAPLIARAVERRDAVAT